MTKKILIVGCGQLGSRHLQSLIKLDSKYKIKLFDPSFGSLEKAIALYTSCGGSLDTIESTQDISTLKESSYDLIIVATNSDVRPELIRDLKNLGVISKNWILEKVLAQSPTLADSIQQTLSGENAWVNCPRMYYECYKEIQTQLKPNLPIHLTVTGMNWGLTCNTIHYLTLLSDFTQSMPIDFDTSGLEPHIVGSKRPGFVEMFGTAAAHYQDGSTLTVTCSHGNGLTRKLSIKQKENSWVVNEFQNQMSSNVENFLNEEIIHVPPQSELTYIIANDIFKKNECLLPTLSRSIKIHHHFLNSLIDFYNNISQYNTSYVPIT